MQQGYATGQTVVLDGGAVRYSFRRFPLMNNFQVRVGRTADAPRV